MRLTLLNQYPVKRAIANENIETLDELKEILSKHCCILGQMNEEIKNQLTIIGLSTANFT